MESVIIGPGAERPVPRIIWFLWLQGLDAAPEIVRICHESWERENPGWELRTLDADTIGRYVDLDKTLGPNRETISRQAISDIARIHLLADHGGVWTDATVFCCKPLDSWLWSQMNAGLFLFTNPGPDRLVSSWFIASSAHNPLICAVRDLLHAYFSDRKFENRRRPNLKRLLEKILSRNVARAGLWFHPVIRDIIRLYPYFWLHYLFAEAIRREPPAADVWAAAGKCDAAGPHRVQVHGMAKPPDPAIASEIDEARQPVYKLDGRRAAASMGTGGALDYLLKRRSRVASAAPPP